MGRHYIPGRAGVTTEGVLNNKYRARCAGRGRCGRGCDIGAAFHSPTALIYPARDSGHLTVRPYSIVSEVLVGEASNRAHRRARHRREHARGDGLQGAGRSCSAPARSTRTRILLNSRSRAHPTGLGNSSGLLGCYLSEHIMGIRGSGYIPARIGTETTLDDGRAVSPYIPRFRNVTDKHPGLHPRLPLPGRRRLRRVPGHGARHPGATARRSSRTCASTIPRSSASAALARCCRARRTASRSIRS